MDIHIYHRLYISIVFKKREVSADIYIIGNTLAHLNFSAKIAILINLNKTVEEPVMSEVTKNMDFLGNGDPELGARGKV